MAKYRKKPVIVDAVQVFTVADHPVVTIATIRKDGTVSLTGDGDICMAIATKEGWHEVQPGDFVITGVKGEHYPCKPDIFAMTYEPAEVEHG